jgi:transcription elongation factor Elf1
VCEYPNECRHCNSSKTKVDQLWISNEIGYHYFVVCEECLMRGPMKVSPSSATADWNSLPERNKRIEVTSERILNNEKALNCLAGSLENMVLLSARTIEKLDSAEVKLLDLVEGNAKVIDEIYCLVDSISKGILERKGGEIEHGELGDPDPRHAGEHPPPAGERKRLSACRHCGSSKVNVNRIRYSEEITGFKFRYFVICEECGMRGPKKSSSKAASEDWDLLPRIANSRLLDMLEKILSIIDKK